MLTYALIGLGGALGSIGRAWIAVAMARLTGPAFPWGTILINVVGSFVIGFFGTITASGGRLPAPTDARAFVMIGICGGFTTFSSFSLQTLDLARDGRPGQALGNVALSVVLCLASVAAGHYAAAGVNAGRVRAAAGPEGLGERVLVVLDRARDAPGVLAAATRLAALEGMSGIEVLAWRAPPPDTRLPGLEVLTAQRALAADEGAWLDEAIDAWRSELARDGVSVRVEAVEGELASLLAAPTPAAAIVVGRALHRDALRAALFASSRPVLVVPPGWGRSFGRVVAIAWRNDPCVPLAVAGALPLLRRAERVHVLVAGEARARVPGVLRRAAIAAEVRRAAAGPTGAALLAAAHACGADLLVMGAYAHGVWREAVLGGVTRELLETGDLPMLMRHHGAS